MEEKKRNNQPEEMHCREKIVASTVEVFHFLWHLQDREQHKSAIMQMHLNACTAWEPINLTNPIFTALFKLSGTKKKGTKLFKHAMSYDKDIVSLIKKEIKVQN